jgi:hypothetical protein
MHTHIEQTLAWIKDAKLFLEGYSDPILSDAETCDYFRQRIKKAPVKKVEALEDPAPKILPPLKIERSPPPPVLQNPTPLDTPVSPPLPPKKKENLLGLRALFSKIAPEMPLLQEIPSDAIAKKIANRWKTKNQIAPITVLSYQENPEHRQFLEQIVKALDVYFGPAKLLIADAIEREKEWKTFLSAAELKLVIACDYTLWQLQNLCPFYKEIPAQKYRQLGEKPLFMLPDLSLYLKDPLLKRSLWKALCQMISSLLSPSTKN